MKAKKNVLYVALFFVSITLFADTSRLDTIRERLNNRSFPSTFDAWGGLGWVHTYGPVVSSLDDSQIVALADLHWTTQDGWSKQNQNKIVPWNPNHIFLREIRMREASPRRYGLDSPFWLRNIDGNPIRSGYSNHIFIDFTSDVVQRHIIDLAAQTAADGIHDGIFFDWWNELGTVLGGHRTNAAEQKARDNIIQGIREEVKHPDFLIIVNINHVHGRVSRNAHLINGGFMETIANDGPMTFNRNRLNEIENTLIWLSQNMREPRVNCLEGKTRLSPSQLLTPAALAWMRLFTTMSLVHSDGFVLYTGEGGHKHMWYDFWDANLGQPVSPKSEQVEGKPQSNCFIREYDNGWTICNRGANSYVATLPEVAVAISTGKYDYIHEVPAMDGEIFLRSHPTRVNTHKKLTTSWGAVKSYYRFGSKNALQMP